MGLSPQHRLNKEKTLVKLFEKVVVDERAHYLG